jgi:hypothetical protein
MRLSSTDITNFPKFAQYVRRRMPEVLGVPVIVNNIRRFATLSRTQFQHALVWGNDPLVIITDLSSGQCGVPAANGCFRTTNPSQIEIDLERVQDFEDDPNGRGTDLTSTSRRVFIVGTTMLHEMCHWGHVVNGIAEPANEPGIAFEVATYGRNTG